MIPSSSDVTYFVEVANTKNISRASERLGISQPSLTLAIQRIENALGTKVLSRSKKGVALTQAGKQLLLHSRQLLQLWENVKEEALASENEIQGNYTIGSHPSVALYSLAGFLPEIMRGYPNVHIHLKHDLSRKIAEGVISSEIDLGLVVNPVKHPDLVIKKLCDDVVTFWTSTGKQSEVQDLKSGKAVLICDPDLAQSQSLMKQLAKKGMRVGRTLTSGNLEVIADLTRNGCGIGILPTRVAQYFDSKRLQLVPKASSYHDEICLLYRVENKNVRSIQRMRELISEYYRV